MKRELLQNVQPIPLVADEVIDRGGFLSAVLAVKPKSSGDLSVKIEHGDAKAGPFTEAKDPGLFIDGNSVPTVADGDLILFDLDLIGCKRFIKVTVSGSGLGEGASALVLGDTSVYPVEADADSGE